jgi:putative transposase
LSACGHSFGPLAGRPSLPNDEAIIRLVGAFAVPLGPEAKNGSLLETNDEGAVARRSMSLETLARVTDNPNIRLPAVAA